MLSKEPLMETGDRTPPGATRPSPEATRSAAANDCLCSRCAAIHGSCCAHREIYLTLADVRRMSTFLGRADFHARRPAGDPDYLPDGTDPDWGRYVFDPQGERRIMVFGPDGGCQFLGPKGCVMPMEIRPLICRLYPWEYDHRGLTGLGGDCPRELLRPGETLVEQLGMADDVLVRAWHRMLYAEMREEPHAQIRDLGLAEHAPAFSTPQLPAPALDPTCAP